MMMPKNLCELEGCIVCPLIMMDGLGIGTVFLGLSVSGIRFLDRHTSAVLSSSNSALCFRLHSSALPGFSIIPLSFPLAISYVLALAAIAMLSMKPKTELAFAWSWVCDL